MFSEAFCDLTFDRGPVETRAQGFRHAIEAFEAAIQMLSGLRGSNPPEAASVRTMALIDHARADLNLGHDAAVLWQPVDRVRPGLLPASRSTADGDPTEVGQWRDVCHTRGLARVWRPPGRPPRPDTGGPQEPGSLDVWRSRPALSRKALLPSRRPGA